MTIHNGLYKLSTKTNDGRVYIGLSHDPEPSNVNRGIDVLAGPESQTTVVEVRSIDANLYELHLWYHSGLGIGYNTAENLVVATSNASEWLIEQGSRPNRYKISITDSHLYWSTVPGAGDITRVSAFSSLPCTISQLCHYQRLHCIHPKADLLRSGLLNSNGTIKWISVTSPEARSVAYSCPGCGRFRFIDLFDLTAFLKNVAVRKLSPKLSILL